MKTLLILTGIFAALISCFSSPATADGVFVWRNEKIDILEPEQKAFIFFRDGREDLVLSVRFEGAPEDFGWIVPVPSDPEISREDIQLFEALSKATQDRQYRRSRRGHRLHTTLGADDVEIVRKQTVGIYDATVLKSSGGFELDKWLQVNGYRLPPGAGNVLDHYIRKNWIFVALKIRPGEIDSLRTAELASGTIQPVRFSFTCDQPVFPLEISSLNTRESRILVYLLSRDILVPCNQDSVPWENQIYSRGANHHWIYQYQQASKMGKFLPDYKAEYHLTKHRVQLSPAEMKDVFFDPYDPATGLASSDSTVRIEAATHIGLQHVTASEQLLLQTLSRNPHGRELYCLLWALGEVGADSAERMLIEYLHDRDIEARLEAIEALARLQSKEALPHAIRGLRKTAPGAVRDTNYLEEEVRRACLDYLLTVGDGSCIPALWEVSGSPRENNVWIGYATPSDSHKHFNRRNQEIMAVAALAACGDDLARRHITDALVAGGEATRHERLVATARSRSSHNGFPGGFWTGIIVESGIRGIHPWPSVRWAHDLFQANEGFRDRLYRECSLDDRLPDAGKIVLIANLSTPADRDIARLMSIWNRSILDPVLTLDVVDAYEYNRRQSRYGNCAAKDLPSIRYNYNACSVVRALARHRRIEELFYAWETAPADDAVLRGDIAYAMAETGDPGFFAVIRDHIREVWGSRANSPEFQQELRCRLALTDPGRKPLVKFMSIPLDLQYRWRAIREYVFGYGRDPSLAWELITDRSLPPYLQLRLLVEPNYFASGFRPLLPVAIEELQVLVSEYEFDSAYEYLANECREYFERVARRLRDRDERI